MMRLQEIDSTVFALSISLILYDCCSNLFSFVSNSGAFAGERSEDCGQACFYSSILSYLVHATSTEPREQRQSSSRSKEQFIVESYKTMLAMLFYLRLWWSKGAWCP